MTRLALGLLIPLGMLFTLIALFNERQLIKAEENVPLTLCEEVQYELEQQSIENSEAVIERCKQRYS